MDVHAFPLLQWHPWAGPNAGLTYKISNVTEPLMMFNRRATRAHASGASW